MQASSIAEKRYPHDWVTWNFEKTLQAYLVFLKENGCQVIIVRNGDNGIEDWYLTNFIRKFRDIAVDIGRREGAIICDFDSVVENYSNRKDLYIDSGVHVTLEGSQMLSSVLLNTLNGIFVEDENFKEVKHSFSGNI